MASSTSPAAQLEHKIRTRTATVGVVGLGYVGLPLLRAFFQAGFPTVGYDVDQQKIDMLKRGE
ncbi:MAG: nucleotide sugar dehydrogenase, partial [Planctomycetes bacterium]|nr:nucleotide sugar dehydrogenase [Planctomycetota bacterium]